MITQGTSLSEDGFREGALKQDALKQNALEEWYKSRGLDASGFFSSEESCSHKLLGSSVHFFRMQINPTQTRIVIADLRQLSHKQILHAVDVLDKVSKAANASAVIFTSPAHWSLDWLKTVVFGVDLQKVILFGKSNDEVAELFPKDVEIVSIENIETFLEDVSLKKDLWQKIRVWDTLTFA